ncbi:MAG: type II toxin-antitoxin system RelE/ParE family toxin [Gemmatimonadales bacterium]
MPRRLSPLPTRSQRLVGGSPDDLRVPSPRHSELIDAAQFYEAQAVELGSRFLDEVERVVGLLRVHPELGRLVADDIRLFPTRRFPYSLVYQVRGTELQVLAVAHHRRQPSYWAGRTG